MLFSSVQTREGEGLPSGTATHGTVMTLIMTLYNSPKLGTSFLHLGDSSQTILFPMPPTVRVRMQRMRSSQDKMYKFVRLEIFLASQK